MRGEHTRERFLNLGHALDHLLMLIFPTVVLTIAPEFGRSYSEMLPLAVGGFVMFGAGSLPAGWLADRWSRRGMMVIFFVGVGASSAFTGLAREPWQLALGITLIGTFGAIYHPVGIAMLVSGRAKVGRLLGVNGVYGNVGVALAALIAGALAHWFGWRAAFIVPGLVAVALGAAFAARVPEAEPRSSAPAARPSHALGRWRLARVFAILLVTTFCGGIIFNSTTVAMPKVFDERLKALASTTLGIGALVSAVYLFAAMAQLVVGRLLDRGTIRSVLLPVVALQVPLLFGAAFFEDHLLLGIALAMMFFVFGQVPINDAMIAAYTDERWRARALGLRYVVSFGASALAVPLVALMHRYRSDFRYLFLVLAGLAALMLCAVAFLPAREREPTPA